MQIILGGRASGPDAAFLMALRMKGETVDELVGFARAMRQMRSPSITNSAPSPARYLRHGRRLRRHIQHFDHRRVRGCGCGGARGQARQPFHFEPVRQRRSTESLGIGIAVSPASGARHSRDRHRFSVRSGRPQRHEARPTVRVDLKMRTVFNLLGPLTNPAGATAQLAGAPRPRPPS